MNKSRGLKSTKSNLRRVFLFNLMMDESHPVLASSCDWAYEFLRKQYEVIVFTTHVGVYKQSQRLKVIEIGGGSFIARIIGLARITSNIVRMRPRIGDLVIHHMSTKTLLWPGIYLKAKGLNQGLWYSHSKSDFFLRLGLILNPYILTPTKKSFPLRKVGSMCFVVGHGVAISDPILLTDVNKYERTIDCVHVGRVAPIKGINLLIEAIQELESISGIKLQAHLVGPISDAGYLKELQETAKMKQVELKILGSKTRDQLHELLLNTNIVFTNTPQSTDKGAVEAASLGCFIVSPEIETLKLCGIANIYDSTQMQSQSSTNVIASQLYFIDKIPSSEKRDIRREISTLNRSHNSLSSLLGRIEKIMCEN